MCHKNSWNVSPGDGGRRIIGCAGQCHSNESSAVVRPDEGIFPMRQAVPQPMSLQSNTKADDALAVNESERCAAEKNDCAEDHDSATKTSPLSC